MVVNFVMGYILPVILLVASGYLIKTFRDERVVKYVGIAVKAAEQIFKEKGMGKEKLAYVKKWVSDKFNIPEEDLTNLIESAVYEINKEQ